MPKLHEMTTREISMRVYRMVEPMIRKPDFLKGDVAERIMDEFGVSRSTAFRQIDTVMDICGVHYESNDVRIGKARDKSAASRMFSRGGSA